MFRDWASTYYLKLEELGIKIIGKLFYKTQIILSITEITILQNRIKSPPKKCINTYSNIIFFRITH